MRTSGKRIRKTVSKSAVGAAMVAASLIGMPIQAGAATGTPSTTAVVHWGSLRQQIVGFGASGAFGQAASLQMMPAKDRNKVLSLLFSAKNGIGLDIVRSLVNDGVDGKTIEPAPGQWDWNIQPDDQIWLMNEARKYGVTTLMSTPWSPPAWMKKNDAVAGGKNVLTNVLLPKYYHAYAVYLAKYVTGYWSHFHIRINVISIQNEPNWNTNYASCVWTPQQFDTFIREDVIPVFKQYDVQAKLMMPEQLNWGEQYALPTLKDPIASKAVSIVAAHGYAGTVAPLPVAEREHKQVWETEISTFGPDDPSITDGLHWAKVVNDYLTVANVNAWNYWWLTNTGTDNEGLININPVTGKYVLNKRLFTIGNYSRFVRPGYYRIAAARSPMAGVFLSAFKDPKTGRFAVVLVNENNSTSTLDVSMKGLSHGPSSVVPYVTSATKNLQEGSPVAFSQGMFTAALPAQSVTTYVGN